MRGLYVEKRDLNGKTSLSWDLAHHMYTRLLRGKIAVVTEDPASLMPAVKKQWMKVMRQVQRQRAATLDPTQILELSNKIAHMQSIHFTARPPVDLLEADANFATADQFVQVPPMCHTLYVTYDAERKKLHMLTSWMPKNALVVLYE